MVSANLSLPGFGVLTGENHLLFVKMDSELMHKWRNRNATRFRGKYRLFHGEQCCCQGLDSQVLQFAAGLQTLPGSWDFDAEPRQIEARV